MVLLRFSRGSGLAGGIVRWSTWSQFAHVGFYLSDVKMVLDATPELGVSIRAPSDDETTEYYRILAPTRAIDAAIAWAKLQVGKPYDWTAIYGMAIRRDWHTNRKWFCSEFVEGAMAQADWPLVRGGRYLDRITPRDLAMSTRIVRWTDPLP